MVAGLCLFAGLGSEQAVARGRSTTQENGELVYMAQDNTLKEKHREKAGKWTYRGAGMAARAGIDGAAGQGCVFHPSGALGGADAHAAGRAGPHPFCLPAGAGGMTAAQRQAS